jgi:hypothetical protein
VRINNDYWSAILSVTKVSGDTGSAKSNSGSLQNLVPGQQVKGEVLARLSDQVHLVKIAGDIYRTELPEPTRPGTTLNLAYRSGEPRPEFALQRGNNEASPVKLSQVTAWLTNNLKGLTDQTAARTVRTLEPLLNAPPANTALLAASLRNSLTFSGVFYDSHLLQWYLGEKRLDEMLKESRLRLEAMANKAKVPPSGTSLPDELALLTDKNNSWSTSLENVNPRDGMNRNPSLVDPAAAPLLREQVETLMTGIFHWQGSVWQNQEMEWEVAKHEGENDQDAENSCWRTTVRLSLPNLGSLSATLIFTGEGIHGRIITESAATRDEMKRELTSLERSMCDSGLTLTDMVIEHSDER